MSSSPNLGIVNFYYTQNLPAEAVAIAKVACSEYTPSDLISINNINVLDQGTLSIWKNTTPITDTADFKAPDLMQSIVVSGDVLYYIDNQFFELTAIVSANSIPLYYQHVLPAGITAANILDSNGNVLDVEMLITNNIVYHSQPDGYYQIRYVDSNGFVQVDMLLFTPTMKQSFIANTSSEFTYTAKVLSVYSSAPFYLRFTTANGYQILAPYNAPSNVPWFVRIRFGVSPTPPEWGNQPWVPFRPYLLGSWVQGSILNNSTIQFERKEIYYNGTQSPDILIFNANNQILYALDGTSINSLSTKGYEYPWAKGLINEVDAYAGRVSVSVNLDPTDIVYGFYAYQENDVLYTDIDVNPFTNPSSRNGQVTFYLKTNGIDTTRYLYYTLTDVNGNVLQTNDTSYSTGTNQIFAQLVVGASVSTSNFTVTDIRQRGGGLTTAYQNIPEAANFWDLGFWNGKPYPAAGALLIYLPQSLLSTMTDTEIQNKIAAILPLGVLATIKYYNASGDEF
jgi:hypothetical protein